MAKDKRQLALDMAGRGIRVMPLHHTSPVDGSCSCGNPGCTNQGKHPIHGEWPKTATTDTATINRWFDKNPDMNYGCLMGSEWVAVDVDVKKVDGFQTLADIVGIDKSGLDAMTFAVASTTGGRHYYFKSDKGYSNTAGTALGGGLDTRAGNGQVVGPGSTIYKYDSTLEEFVERAYEIINDGPIVDIPQSISTRLSASKDRVANADQSVNESLVDSPGAVQTAVAYLKSRAGAVQYQGGNDWTYKTALGVRDCNISHEKCVELMLEHWDEKCDPPWGDEIGEPIANAYNYAKNKIGNKSIGLMEFVDSLESSEDDVPEHLLSNDDDLMGDGKEDWQAKFGKHCYTASEFLKLQLNYDFVVRNWLPAQGYTIMLGKRGSGKSTVLMDIMCSIATDREWYGNHVSEKWTVVYVAAEDPAGIKARFEAWCEKYGTVPADDRLLFFDMGVDLLNAKQVSEYTKFIANKVEKREKVLFVWDTWQRVTSTADGGQSDDVSMQRALDNLDAMCRSFKGPSIVAAHPPKGNEDTMSGSGILENRSDAIWKIFDDEAGVRKMGILRIKGASEESNIKFAMTKIPISGFDESGARRISIVAERRGTTTADGKTEITDAMQMRNTKLVKLAADIFDLHGNIEGETKKLLQNGSMLLSNLVDYCHRAMHIKKDDTSTVMQEWKRKLQELGYTEFKLKPITDDFRASRSEIYNALNNLGRENGNLYPIDGALSLQWGLHGIKPTVKVVNTTSLMDRTEEHDPETGEILPNKEEDFG